MGGFGIEFGLELNGWVWFQNNQQEVLRQKCLEEKPQNNQQEVLRLKRLEEKPQMISAKVLTCPKIEDESFPLSRPISHRQR